MVIKKAEGIMIKQANNFHALSIEKTFETLGTSEKGLSKRQVEKRLNKFGFNELLEKKKINPLIIFLNQFRSFSE